MVLSHAQIRKNFALASRKVQGTSSHTRNNAGGKRCGDSNEHQVECELVARPDESAHRCPGRRHLRDKNCSPMHATTNGRPSTSTTRTDGGADEEATSGSGTVLRFRDAAPMVRDSHSCAITSSRCVVQSRNWETRFTTGHQISSTTFNQTPVISRSDECPHVVGLLFSDERMRSKSSQHTT